MKRSEFSHKTMTELYQSNFFWPKCDPLCSISTNILTVLANFLGIQKLISSKNIGCDHGNTTRFLGGSCIFICSLHLPIILMLLQMTNNTAELSGSHSKCSIIPTAQITNPSNSEQQVLSSHKAAADAERVAAAAHAMAAQPAA